ncbi:Lcl C-terminal domain-containing protein, partial [Vibrio sp. V34_P3A8T189]
YYQYTMQDILSASTSSAILRVTASNSQPDQGMRQFSAVTQVNDTVLINVNDGSVVPDGYVIDENSIQVLGLGRAYINPANGNEIYYQAGSEMSAQGLHRIVFSYINASKQSIIQGLIDVAVGSTVSNRAPMAKNFRYGDTSSFTLGQQLDYIKVKAWTEITIDIAPYFNQGYLDAYGSPIALTDSNGNSIFDEKGNQVHFYLEADKITSTPIYKPGNYLIDGDKDLVQLIDVYAYNAHVSISKNASFTNTSFTFKSNKTGLHYVTYVLSDHNGGYATGVIEIYVHHLSKLNDTGVDWCMGGYGLKGPCPMQAPYGGQDGDWGRDALASAGDLDKIGDGVAGFDFSKIDAYGFETVANQWNCIRDNVTGLMWEAKGRNGLLSHRGNTYTWYNPDNISNGGYAGIRNGGACLDSECDIYHYVRAVNQQKFCGYDDWRIPTVHELYSIVNKSYRDIDTNYFMNTPNSHYWTSNPFAGDSDKAWVVFGSGTAQTLRKTDSLHAILVRSTQ